MEFNKIRIFFSFCLLVFLFQHNAFGQNEEDAKRVLFVGNSYTYFWNLPQTVALMAESRDISLITNQSTSGGVNLGMHWNSKRKLETVQKIKKGDFDVVILQDHSLRPILEPDSTLKYGKLLGDLAKESGANTFVYTTWARENNPMMQRDLTNTYRKLAKEVNGTPVPVGEVWELARKIRPELPLYDPDGSHPSTLGTYLTACVFFGVLTGQNPVGLPHRLITKDKDGETLYIMIVDQVDALFCQQITAEFLSKYGFDLKN